MKQNFKRLFVCVLVLVATMSLAACKMLQKVEAIDISLNTTSLTLTIGDTSVLTAFVEPTDADQGVTWSSSDTTTVTVERDGKVYAVGVGSAIITAKTFNDLAATCEVTVKDIDSSLIHTVTKPIESSFSIPQPNQLFDQTWDFVLTEPGETQTFTYTAQTANYMPLTIGRFRFTSTYSVIWRITDSMGNNILSGYDGNINGVKGRGHNCILTIGVTYTITIQKSTENGPCEFKAYAPNGLSDITGKTKIVDKLWYDSQISIYTYTPTITGRYLLQSSYTVDWRITDSYGNVKIYGYSGSIGGSRGYWHNVTLEAGEQYTIQIQKWSTSGENIIEISQPNPQKLNITGKQKIYDSMRFSGQVNSYIFIPSEAGTYRLATSFTAIWNITDSYGNVKISGYAGSIGGSSSSSHEITLKEGEQYTILLEKESSGSGDYTFEIKKQ